MLHAIWLLSVLGGDPSPTWEAYAVYTPFGAVASSNVTLVAATYVVPQPPLDVDDGTAPKWWVGLQSADGMGVLMKPQLTWQNATWVISTEVLDYSVVPSFKALSAELEVRAGQLVDASVRETGGAGSGVYTLTIGARAAAPARGGARVPAAAASATSAVAAVSSQVYTAGVAETRAYAVMEHQVSGLLLIDCFAAVMRGAAARACLAYR
jgi:hypothetical protein